MAYCNGKYLLIHEGRWAVNTEKEKKIKSYFFHIMPHKNIWKIYLARKYLENKKHEGLFSLTKGQKYFLSRNTVLKIMTTNFYRPSPNESKGILRKLCSYYFWYQLHRQLTKIIFIDKSYAICLSHFWHF